jgi:hypothetical protein
MARPAPPAVLTGPTAAAEMGQQQAIAAAVTASVFPLVRPAAPRPLTGDPSAGEIAIHPGWDSTDGQLPQGPADSDEGDSTDVRPDRRSYPQAPDLSQGLY